MEQEIGRITHYFNKIGVAVVALKDALKVGETIKIKGGEKEFEQAVDSMQIDNKSVEEAAAGQEVGMKVSEPVREGYIVYKVTEE